MRPTLRFFNNLLSNIPENFTKPNFGAWVFFKNHKLLNVAWTRCEQRSPLLAFVADYAVADKTTRIKTASFKFWTVPHYFYHITYPLKDHNATTL